MSRISINCPDCSTKLSVNRPTTAPVQFKCPRCGKLLKLSAQDSSSNSVGTPPNASVSQSPSGKGSSDSLSDFDFGQLPDASVAPQNYSSFHPSMYAARGKSNRRKDWRQLLMVSGLLLTIALFSFAGIAAYLWLPAGLINSLNPLGDSHSSVLNRLNDIGAEMDGILASVQDESGRDLAIDKLKTLSLETIDLKRRVARLGEIDDQEYDRLVIQFNKDAEASKERMRQAITNLSARNLYSKKLADTRMELAISMQDVAMTTKIAWKALPPPKSKAEQLAHHKIEIERDIWREFLAVTSLDQYNNLPDRLASFPSRYDSLRDLQIEVSKQSPGAENSVFKYNGISFDVSFQLADLSNKLQSQYGSNTALHTVQDEIKAAKSDLVRAGIESSSPSRAGWSTSNGPPQFGTPGFPPGFPPQGVGSSGQSINQPMQRSRAKPTYILRIRSDLNLLSQASDMLDKVISSDRNDHGPNSKIFYAFREGNTTVILFKYNGTVDEVVSRIDFGRILSIDRQKREILVDYNK